MVLTKIGSVDAKKCATKIVQGLNRGFPTENVNGRACASHLVRAKNPLNGMQLLDNLYCGWLPVRLFSL